jgi:hypothetical protein
MKYQALVVGFGLIAIALSIPGWAGNGLGAGDGYPRIQYETVDLPQLPELESLRGQIKTIAKEYPSLAFRLNLLASRFGNQVEYRFIHQRGNYPYQYANSSSWPIRDQWGIPNRAEITVWNEFFEIGKEKRIEVILHELIHILITANHENETQAITLSLLGQLREGLPDSARALLTAGMSEISRAATSEQNDKVLAYFHGAGGVPGSCKELGKEKELFIGGKAFLFHSIDEPVLTRLQRDPLLALHFLYGCLRQTPEGRSLVDGFFEHPSFRLLFARAILERPLFLKIIPKTFTLDQLETRNAAPFYKELVEKLALLIKKGPDKNVLRELLPGFSDWETLQVSIIGNERPSKPVVFSASHLLQLGQDVIRHVNDPDLTKIDFYGAHTSEFRVAEFDEGGIQLNCIVKNPGWFGLGASSKNKSWKLNRVWMMKLLRNNSPISYNQWPSMIFRESTVRESGQ